MASADEEVELDAKRRKLRFFVNAYGPGSSKLGHFKPGAGSAAGGVELDAWRRRLRFFVNAHGPRSPKPSDIRPGGSPWLMLSGNVCGSGSPEGLSAQRFRQYRLNFFG